MAVVHNRILRMSKEERELYANDPIAFKLFIEEELELLSDPDEGFAYFWDNYAVHIPVGGGGPEALPSFPFQSKLAREVVKGDHIFDKPRRMGVTLEVGCAYPVWFCLFKRGGEAADIKVVSKGQTEADEVISNCKMILDALPDWLNPLYGTRSRDEHGRPGVENNSRITFPHRGNASIRALTSSGARSFKATVLIIDEQAWQPDAAETWEGSKHAAEGGGQIICISTGNGKTGRGKTFHDLYWKARRGEINMTPHFFPWWARTDRDLAWYEEEKARATSIEKFYQECPATEEQSFSGYSEGSAYETSHIVAANKLGAKYDAWMGTDDQVIPTEEGVFVGIDWGDNSAAAFFVGIAGFGYWQIDEYVTNKDDAETFSRIVITRAKEWADALKTDFNHAYYDAAGKQQMKSFARMASQLQVGITAIPFSKYKISTIQFSKMLLRRTEAGDAHGFWAISPRCIVTTEQMKDIKHKENGDFKKGNDHSIDAAISALAPAALRWDRQLK